MFILSFLILPSTVISNFVHSPSASVQSISPIQNYEIQNNCGRIGGNKQTGMNKIDFGDLARAGQFPWAIAIEVKDVNGTMHRHCSATLISTRHAITAAHCVLDIDKCADCSSAAIRTDKCDSYSNAEKTTDPSTWTIAYGGHCNLVDADKIDESCREDNMKRIGVRAIAWDHRFANHCQFYDVAIVEFKKDIELDFESGTTLPICLADSSFPFDKSLATFYGFGKVAEDNDARHNTVYSQLRYGVARHTYTKQDGSEMFLDARLNRTESERNNVPFLPRSNFANGDSGGGISTTSCDGSTVLIGVIARSTTNSIFSFASVLHTHINDICTLIGICPTVRC